MTFPDLTTIDLTAEDMSGCGKQGMIASAGAPDVDRVTGYSRDPRCGCLSFFHERLQRMS
jgi:hypothetical protein